MILFDLGFDNVVLSFPADPSAILFPKAGGHLPSEGVCFSDNIGRCIAGLCNRGVYTKGQWDTGINKSIRVLMRSENGPNINIRTSISVRVNLMVMSMFVFICCKFLCLFHQ